MAEPTEHGDQQCPSEDVLRRFLSGELDAEEDQAVADHLDHCSECQKRTKAFVSVDDLSLPWVKASARETIMFADTSADVEILEQLKRIGRATREREEKIAVPKQIDKYEIVALIGQGGMGAIYQGIDHELDCECAIKVLKESRSSNRKAIERSQREMLAITRLQHPNIVSVLNSGYLEDGRALLVMEFLRGSDLQSYVEAHEPFAVDVACRIAIEAARGLQHAHEQGLVHRDVKPSNLFVTTEGQVKVLDFGLVQLKCASFDNTDPLTETGLVLGTVDFMSPEQAGDPRTADYRSDIYSLGCTLAWLVSGKVLFPSKSPTKTLFGHRDQPAPPLETLRPGIPAGVNDVFQKMVAKQPDNRFQSMTEVIDALSPFTQSGIDENGSGRDVQTDFPSPAPPPSDESNSPPPEGERRNGVVLVGVIVALLLGLLVLLLFNWSDGDADSRSQETPAGIVATSAEESSS